MSNQLTDQKAIDLWLEEERQNAMLPDHRHVALYGLGAIGDIDKLLVALSDNDPEHAAEREDAAYVLRRYLSHGLEASRRVFNDDGKMETGILVAKYGKRDGRKIFDLLHDLNPKEITPAAFEALAMYLKSDNIAVRHLAYGQLYRLGGPVELPSKQQYNAAMPRQMRDDIADEYLKLIASGALPRK